MSSPARLPHVAYPRLEALFRAGEEVWQRRPDVREAHGSVESWGYWCWMMFSGAVEHAELQSNLYPVPDSFLIERVVGSLTREQFVNSGVIDASRFRDCLVEAGVNLEAGGRMLDFGCGCGRLLRILARLAHRFELHGVDVDADAIAFSRESFDFASFERIGTSPPTGFGDDSFDVIYAYSVFTHLTEPGSRAWLDELARIAKPGATVVLTTGGCRLVEHFLEGVTHDPIPSAAALKARLPELEERGFLFFPYEKLECPDPRNVEFFEAWDLEAYGMTFVLESYVREHWLEHFELLAHRAAPDDWQDYVVLRRRGS